MSLSYDDESTLLVVTAAPRFEEDAARTFTTIPSRAFKWLTAVIGMMACAAYLGGASTNDRSNMVALVNPDDPNYYPPYEGDLKECPDECQFTGEQITEWHDASGRLCCQDSDANGGICELNRSGDHCNCKDVGHTEPCYIDTRCEPFQTVQDGKCKAKPGTECGDRTLTQFFDCTKGYVCDQVAYNRDGEVKAHSICLIFIPALC